MLHETTLVHGFFMLDKEYTVRYTVGRSHIYYDRKGHTFSDEMSVYEQHLSDGINWKV